MEIPAKHTELDAAAEPTPVYDEVVAELGGPVQEEGPR